MRKILAKATNLKCRPICLFALAVFALAAGWWRTRSPLFAPANKGALQSRHEHRLVSDEFAKVKALDSALSSAPKNEKIVNRPEEIPETPSQMRLEVPFSSQAPFARWDSLHEEACEEMSLIMAGYYFLGKKLTPQLAEDELQKLIAWEKKQFGYFEDTTAYEVAQIAREYFGLKAQTQDLKQKQIERAIRDNKLVLLPAYGRALGNPYFSGAGPAYHMLVVIGYNKQNFITNDPGTKRGKNYSYQKEILLGAVHDWTGDKKTVPKGKQTMIVVAK